MNSCGFVAMKLVAGDDSYNKNYGNTSTVHIDYDPGDFCSIGKSHLTYLMPVIRNIKRCRFIKLQRMFAYVKTAAD